MITLGVDLAASAPSTALALVDWDTGAVRTRLGVGDDEIVEAAEGADRIGIDCPFGWPDAFVDFVGAHHAFGATAPAGTIAQRRPLAYRATDEWCRAERGLRPLSVSADRIAHAAFRCAGLLAALGVTDRSGAGRAIETYPAGSLRHWQLYRPGYKRDASARDSVVAQLLRGCALTGAPIASDHELDALVCALTARAAVLGLVEQVPAEHGPRAVREGWIRLPTCGLSELRAG